MKLSREKIQRMIGQRDSGNGGGGTSPDIDLSGYVSMNYLLGLKWWGQSLDNGVVVGAMTGVAGITMTGAISGTTNITMTGMLTGATNVSTQKVTIGGFEVEYDSGNNALKFNGNIYATGGVTALGQGSGGGGGSTALVDLVDVAISNPTNGQVLKYNSTTGKWYNGTDQGVTSLDWSAITNKPDTATRWPSFSEVTSKPTTLSGYGITDAKIANGVITLGSNTITPLTSVAFSDLTTHPTTLSGYGITDAKIANGVITLGSNTITPLTSVKFSDLTTHPTTLSGYGITDAKIVNGIITLGSNSITPLTSSDISDMATKTWVNQQGYLTSQSDIGFSQLPTMYWADVQISNQSNNNTSPQFGNLRLRPGSDNYGSYLRFGDGNYAYIAELTDDVLTYTATTHIFNTGNTGDYSEVMRISSNKNVGIGTNTPSYKLDVSGDVRVGTSSAASKLIVYGAQVSDDSKGLFICASDSTNRAYITWNGNISSSDYMNIHTGWGNICLTPNKNVGIGTTSPSYKLDVSGTAHFSDAVYLAGNKYYSGGYFGLHCNNSDIVGVNRIVTSDLSDSYEESLSFVRTDGNYDTFRAANGTFFFEINNATAANTNKLSSSGFLLGHNMTDVWSDGTNSHPWYGIDNTHHNSGVYSFTISDFFGITLRTGGSNSGVFIKEGGNVGIGVTDPSYRLDIRGSINSSSLGSINGFNSLELTAGSSAGNGGGIYFHYNGGLSYSSVYLTETTKGILSVQGYGTTGLVVGDANNDYIQIGGIRLVYDSTNNALKVVKSDGSSAANFYATGGVASLGIASVSSSPYYNYLTVGTQLDVSGRAYFNDDIYVNVGGSDYLLDGYRCVELGIFKLE